MIVFALLVAVGTLVVGIVAALVLRRLPSIRLQLAGLGLLAVALPLAAVLVSGVVMFDSEHDLTILLVAAACSTAALAAAGLLGGSILRSLERVRSASTAIAGGDLAARAPEDGPAELAELGASFNEMAASVEELFDARRQLVAWASHDLRTPLASMQAMLEAVEDGLVEPERYVPALKQQVDASRVLVDDLFELARLDAGVLSLELRRSAARRRRPLGPGRARGRGGGAARRAGRAHRRRPDGALRSRQGRARAPEPADERDPAHALRRLGGRDRRAARRRGARQRRGHRRGHPRRLDEARLRPLLAR